MKRNYLLVILLLIAFGPALAEDTKPQDPVILYVNNVPVTQSLLRMYYLERGVQIPSDEIQRQLQQRQVVNELINLILLSEQANTNKLQEKQEVKTALLLSEKTVLSKAMIADYMAGITVSSEEQAAAYQGILQEAEYRAEYKIS